MRACRENSLSRGRVFRPRKDPHMTLMRSRRDFLRESGLLIAASSAGLARVFAAEGSPVIAETAYGRVRGTDDCGNQGLQGHSVRRQHSGQEQVHAPSRSCEVDRRARRDRLRVECTAARAGCWAATHLREQSLQPAFRRRAKTASFSTSGRLRLVMAASAR